MPLIRALQTGLVAITAARRVRFVESDELPKIRLTAHAFIDAVASSVPSRSESGPLGFGALRLVHLSLLVQLKLTIEIFRRCPSKESTA